LQGLADAARVIERGEAIVEKFENTVAMLSVEFAEFAGGRSRQLNGRGHAASEVF
jgi:hypothetical protein